MLLKLAYLKEFINDNFLYDFNSFAIEHRWNVMWKFMCWDVGLWLFLSIEFFILCLNILCKLVCSLVRVAMRCKLVNFKENIERYGVFLYVLILEQLFCRCYHAETIIFIMNVSRRYLNYSSLLFIKNCYNSNFFTCIYYF